MPFTILIFAYRKLGTTPADFRAHYEDKHVPLIKSLAGEHFPVSHTRRYIARSAEAPEYPAISLVGRPADFMYDAIAELVFRDEAAFQSMAAVLSTGEAAEKLAADEEAFLDRARTRIVVVAETTVTT